VKLLLLADGSSVHAARYQTELKKIGVEVALASIEDGPSVDIKLNKLTGIDGIDYIFAASTIKKIIAQGNFDIINPHFACGYGFMTALSGVWKTKPVLLHCLGSDILISPKKSSLHKWRVKYALKKSDKILVDSEYLGLKVKEIYDGAKYRVIAWGADTSAFEKFESRERNGFAWHRPIKIIVPRPHHPVYNNDFIIDALKEPLINNKIRISFPSWGDKLEEFKRLVKSEQLEDQINYYDFKSRELFNEFLSDFDIYLSAAVSDSSPASLIEAMAAGLYPIVGDIPGVREWIDGNNGTLFDLSDTKSLSETINNIFGDMPNLPDILRRNFMKAKKDGVFSKNIEDTATLMKEMIDNVRPKE